MLAVLLSAAFAASAQAAPTAITEFPVEVGRGTSLDHIALGADGTVWFDDYYWPDGSYHQLVGRRDPGGQIAEFDQGLGKNSNIRDMLTGPNGNIWFADGGTGLGGAAIGKITPDGSIAEYGGLGGSRPKRIVSGADGALWFATSDSPAIGRVSLDGALSVYGLPGGISDLTAGPDGNVWFTYGGEGVDPAIGRLERHPDGSAVVTYFRSGLASRSEPKRIVAAGGFIWFSDGSKGEAAIGRVSTGGEITEFRWGLSSRSNVSDLAPGPDGNVWFTDSGAGAVGRISSNGQISEFGDELAPPSWDLPEIVAGPDGNMWFTFSGAASGLGKITSAGKMTIFRAGYPGSGLDQNSSLGAIAAGLNGELWAVATRPGFSSSLVRIVPGDDEPPKPSPGTATGGSIPRHVAPGQVLLVGARKLRPNRRGRVRVGLACRNTTGPCSGMLTLTIFDRSVVGGRRTASSAWFWLAPESTGSVSLQVGRAARRLLAAGRRLRAELSAMATSDFTMSPIRLTIGKPRKHHRPSRSR